jgi:hypothetical protein
MAPMTCTIHGQSSTTPGAQAPPVDPFPLPPAEMPAVVGAQTTISPGPSPKVDVRLVQQE